MAQACREGWALLPGFIMAVLRLGLLSRLYFTGNERAEIHVGGVVLR